jgi:fructose-bisphosphate aldolase class I
MYSEDQLARFETGDGFLAALDQSGGSTPGALQQYGIDPTTYSSEAEMFERIQEERARIVTSPAFRGDRILATILFEDTLGRDIDGVPVPAYLWEQKDIVPFLKIDKGLLDEADGVQLMRDTPGLDDTLATAAAAGILGTKERSVIHAANADGIGRIVEQQFAIAERVLAAGLIPILEPEVSITAPDKERAEVLLKAAIVDRLAELGDNRIALKITIPTVDDFYSDLIDHPNIARVVALSGGYERAEACARLARNHNLIASFSRALLDGLSVHQTKEQFDEVLGKSIEEIYRASIT